MGEHEQPSQPKSISKKSYQAPESGAEVTAQNTHAGTELPQKKAKQQAPESNTLQKLAQAANKTSRVVTPIALLGAGGVAISAMTNRAEAQQNRRFRRNNEQDIQTRKHNGQSTLTIRHLSQHLQMRWRYSVLILT